MKFTQYLVILFLCLASSCNAQQSHDAHYPDIPGISATVLIKTTKAWNGAVLPEYGSGQPEINIIRYQFSPGSSIPMHMHPVINAGVLLQGELTVTTKSGQTVQLKAGDPLVELFKEWYFGANSGSEVAD